LPPKGNQGLTDVGMGVFKPLPPAQNKDKDPSTTLRMTKQLWFLKPLPPTQKSFTLKQSGQIPFDFYQNHDKKFTPLETSPPTLPKKMTHTL